MKLTIKDAKRINAEKGKHFFSKDTMRFFDSKIESDLFTNNTFITSEKRCFDDYTRVFAVRLFNPETGSIETLERNLLTKEDARKLARAYRPE